MGQRGLLRTLEHGRLGFWCPGCQSMHVVNAGWTFNGNWDRPTLYPSVFVKGYRYDGAVDVPFFCHSYVTDGQIQYLADSSHALAGQTVPLTLEPRDD